VLSGGATKGCGGGLKKETKKDIKTRHGRGCVDGRGRGQERRGCEDRCKMIDEYLPWLCRLDGRGVVRERRMRGSMQRLIDAK
jgi:hypothetical protein